MIKPHLITTPYKIFKKILKRKEKKPMKTGKKILALALVALMLTVAMNFTAFAATIEVDGAYENETYNAYKILEYTSNTTIDPPAFSYYLTDAAYKGALGNALEAVGFKFTQSADGTQWFVNNSEELTNGAAIAEALSASIDTWKDAALASATTTGTADKKALFNDLPTGYWFVTSSLGSLCTLQSHDAEKLVVEKNTTITDTKEVSDNEVQVGDTVTYTVTLTDGKGTNLEGKVIDTMSKGLTYNDDAVCVANGKTLDKGTDYSVTVTNEADGKTVVEYLFTAKVMTELQEGEKIAITYTATVNADASLDGTEQNIEFSQYSEQETNKKTIEVVLEKLKINKTDGTNALKGAQFELYRTDATCDPPAADHTPVPVRVLSNPELTAAGIIKEADTVYYEVEKDGTNFTIDMTNASSAVVYSLDKDSTYYLQETKAPDGYNLLEKEIEVHLNETNSINVVNNSGSILPSTGGIGTTIFYIVGGALVLGAVVVLIARRRVRNNKK